MAVFGWQGYRGTIFRNRREKEEAMNRSYGSY